jgi:hypothetical protein
MGYFESVQYFVNKVYFASECCSDAFLRMKEVGKSSCHDAKFGYLPARGNYLGLV